MAAVPSLEWQHDSAEICEQMGSLVQADPSDGSSRVKIPTRGLEARLPTSTLTGMGEQGSQVPRLMAGGVYDVAAEDETGPQQHIGVPERYHDDAADDDDEKLRSHFYNGHELSMLPAS